MIRWWYIPAMVVLVAVLHFGAVWSGFYDWQFATKVFWFDNVLHGLVGIGFAMGTLFLIERSGIPLNAVGRTGGVLLAVLILASAWELAEYIFFTQFTEYAYWSRIYSPSVSEALSDIVSDLIGAGFFLAVVKRAR